MCLFVAGVIEPDRAPRRSRRSSSSSPRRQRRRAPAYGAPASLAKLVLVRAQFFGGACLVQVKKPGSPKDIDEDVYTVKTDFYGAYHVPFFATYAVCEHAALLAARGDAAGAAALLKAVADKAPGRAWLTR